MTTAVRFWSKVSQTGNVCECWDWTAAIDGVTGYGKFWQSGLMRSSHRIAWELTNGRLTGDLQIDHLCRNRACVNPWHLEAVTQAENIRRGASEITHCPSGHEYTPQNTRSYPNRCGGVGRQCVACKNARNKARYQ